MNPATVEILRSAVALLVEAIREYAGDAAKLRAAVSQIQHIIVAVRSSSLAEMDHKTARAELAALAALILAGDQAPDIVAGDAAADAELRRRFPDEGADE